jgi:ATP-dependent DNA ligase
MPPRSSFIEPCLPSTADQPPSGPEWIHEIKHDGYRLMARRDSAGIHLITRRGNDWSDRFPLVVEAVNHLKVQSCLIDGEVVCCDERGLARFDLLRRRRNEAMAFLYAFDLLELNGQDLRREPLEVRKATLASILRKARCLVPECRGISQADPAFREGLWARYFTAAPRPRTPSELRYSDRRLRSRN